MAGMQSAPRHDEVVIFRSPGGTRDDLVVPRWLAGAERQTRLRRRRLRAALLYILPRLPGAVWLHIRVGTRAALLETVYVARGLGRVIDGTCAFCKALDHKETATRAAGTKQDVAAQLLFVNARKSRARLVWCGAIPFILGTGLGLYFWCPQGFWAAIILLAGVLDFVGRSGQTKRERIPRKLRPLAEGIPVRQLRKSVADILVRRKLDNRIELAGVTCSRDGLEYRVSVTTQVPLTPALLRTLERDLQAPPDSATVQVDPDNASDCTICFQLGNPLAVSAELPWIPAGSVSAWEPLPLGSSSNPDNPCAVTFAGQNTMWVGTLGAGKTEWLQTCILQLSACRDAVNWLGTLVKDFHFESWGDIIQRRASEVHEISGMLDDALAEIRRRDSILREINNDDDPEHELREWIPELGPLLYLWFDEFPRITKWDGTKVAKDGSKPNLLAKVESIMQTGRALAVNVGLCVQTSGNTGTGTTAISKAVNTLFVGACSQADTTQLFGKAGQESGYLPHKLQPAVPGNPGDAGMAYARGPGFGPWRVRGGAPFPVKRAATRRRAEWAALGNRPELHTNDASGIIDAQVVPAALDIIDRALEYYQAGKLSTERVLDYAASTGENWTSDALARALKVAFPDRPLQARVDRCDVQEKRLRCYLREDIDAALASLG